MSEKTVNQEFVVYEDGSFVLFIDADDLESFREKWVKYRELIDFYVGMVKEEAQKMVGRHCGIPVEGEKIIENPVFQKSTIDPTGKPKRED